MQNTYNKTHARIKIKLKRSLILGGAVAIDIAIREEVSQRIWCLIVENTFTSIPDMTIILINNNYFFSTCHYKRYDHYVYPLFSFLEDKINSFPLK